MMWKQNQFIVSVEGSFCSVVLGLPSNLRFCFCDVGWQHWCVDCNE